MAKQASITNITKGGNLIDDYGVLSAKIAELEARREVLKARLLNGECLVRAKQGDRTMVGEGKLFRVTVAEFERRQLNMERVREQLSAQFIRANTSTTIMRKVSCVARNNERMAA